LAGTEAAGFALRGAGAGFAGVLTFLVWGADTFIVGAFFAGAAGFLAAAAFFAGAAFTAFLGGYAFLADAAFLATGFAFDAGFFALALALAILPSLYLL
jgi:hypothetical protein